MIRLEKPKRSLKVNKDLEEKRLEVFDHYRRLMRIEGITRLKVPYQLDSGLWEYFFLELPEHEEGSE